MTVYLIVYLLYATGKSFKILKTETMLKCQCRFSTPRTTNKGEFSCKFGNFDDLHVSGRYFSYTGIPPDIRILVCCCFQTSKNHFWNFKRLVWYSGNTGEMGLYVKGYSLQENCLSIRKFRALYLNGKQVPWSPQWSVFPSWDTQWDFWKESGLLSRTHYAEKQPTRGEKRSKWSWPCKGRKANVHSSKQLVQKVQCTLMPVYYRDAPVAQTV